MKATVVDKIQELHQAVPFRPFEISLDDGTRVIVDRPEFLGVFSRRDRIFYSTPEDTTEVIQVSRVAHVEPVHRRGNRKE
jgi:hypothetical protein